MIGKKITVLHGEKIQFIFDRCRLFKGISRAMVSPRGLQLDDFKIVIKNTIHTSVREFDKVKPESKRHEGKKAEVPSPQNVVPNASNLEEGLNYHLNQKSLNYQELLSPFMVNRVLTFLGR